MLPRSKRARVTLALIATLLLAVIVPPYITLDRLKGRIASTISNSIGRKTTIGNIKLRLLPQPGFDLTNFAVEDDPAFSAEPMIRADEVTAALRLSALWQGRFEVAHLSLKQPSLNLVRNPQGDWNIEALLARASQFPVAPTAKHRPEARPRFPYIEADDGRINFKFGQEKKSLAFSEADFALWLAAENEWHMRLEARPIRTDAHLSDTGDLRIEGSAVRGPTLSDTAVHFDYDWSGAQLGNLTQLVWGRDRGWRGGIEVSGSVAGTPRELLLAARAHVADFRRYDILAGEALNADTTCSARYLSDTQTLANIDCHLPAGAGEISARGTAAGFFGDRRWDLSVTAADLPMSELVRFARHAKRDMPADLTATGDLDATFTYRTLGSNQVWSGGGATSEVRLLTRALDPPLALGAIRFAVGPVPDPLFPAPRRSPFHSRAPADQPTISRLTLQPFTVALGGPAPVIVEGTVDRQSYSLAVKGDGDVRRMLTAATAFGLRPPQLDADGAAHLQLGISGAWQGFAAPAITGNAQLHNVTADVKGVNARVFVATALLTFSVERIDSLATTAGFVGSSILFQGNVHLPTGCSTLLDCPFTFELTSPVLNLDDLNRLFNPRFAAQPWYHFIVGSTPTTGLRRLRAEGTLSTPHLMIKSVVVNHASATLRFANGRLALKDLAGDLLGGKEKGEWSADFSGATPVYAGAGTIDKADVAQLAALMRDSWGTGAVSGIYNFSATGDTAADIALSAQGKLEFDWKNGLLRHVALHGASPLRIQRFRGTVTLRSARLNFDAGRMETPEGIYTVSGSSTFARAIDFKLLGPMRSYSVTGTVDRPRVIVPPATEAVFKQ